jgi:hypothetical protein
MTEVHTDHFLPFISGWLIVMVCLTAGLSQVKTPHLKLLFTRILAVVGCTALLLGAWWLARTANSLVFAAVGCITVVGLNLLTMRICPHCAKTIYPRTMLAIGFCPRCGTNLSAPHERTATWNQAPNKL